MFNMCCYYSLIGLHSVPFHLLQLTPFLLFPLDLLEIIANHLPMMTRMDFGKLGTQTDVEFLKVLHCHGPHRLVHRPQTIAIDVGDDTPHQSFVQNVLWFSFFFWVVVSVFVITMAKKYNL